jgi:hypothetical protein
MALDGYLAMHKKELGKDACKKYGRRQGNYGGAAPLREEINTIENVAMTEGDEK